jgi:hypothetical protein
LRRETEEKVRVRSPEWITGKRRKKKENATRATGKDDGRSEWQRGKRRRGIGLDDGALEIITGNMIQGSDWAFSVQTP